MTVLLAILIILGVTVATSFSCSITEACLYSVTRSRIETLRRGGKLSGRVLTRVRTRIDDSIAAILIVNTAANALGPFWAGVLIQRAFGQAHLTAFSVAFAFAILFLGEIVPKSLGVRFAPALAPILAFPLQMMVWGLWPLIKACSLTTRLWGRNVHISHGTEEDIISLTRLIEREGVLLPHEAAWVANALRLDEVTAYDLMTPNPVVARVPENMPLRITRADADHWRFSRLPVCADDNPDKIVGVVHRRKVFDALARDEFDRTIGELMEKAEFVPENLPAHQLLDRFLKRRRHLFCVVNERDLFTGVVTLEDVMECLLGREIVDETDLHEDMQAVARRRKEALLSRRAESDE
ncbi:DUF21 domain-containing protein [Candidatus Sumerlaeota bacterium]|nr:DUF21 domain-containing protein [Candidatus Sumerlaeota bacterium]